MKIVMMTLMPTYPRCMVEIINQEYKRLLEEVSHAAKCAIKFEDLRDIKNSPYVHGTPSWEAWKFGINFTGPMK